jgi:predicted methyltransferase
VEGIDQDPVQEIIEWENTIHMATMITEVLATTLEKVEMVMVETEGPSAMTEETEDLIQEMKIETTEDHQEVCQHTTVVDHLRITGEDLMILDQMTDAETTSTEIDSTVVAEVASITMKRNLEL